MKYTFLIFLSIIFSCKEQEKTAVTPEGGQQEKVSVVQQEEEEVSDTIRINIPEKNAVVNSPLKVSGEARGYWFFEGVAPVEITDKKGNILSRGYVKAEGEWMTEDFVPFTGVLNFDAPGIENGFVIFRKSNPSGLSEHDRSVKIPVQFQ